jgi:hypothetical protein
VIQTRTFNRSGYYSKSLTNYFIASNQIVNQLRRRLDDNELLRKIQFLPASKAVELRWTRPITGSSGAGSKKLLGKPESTPLGRTHHPESR